MILTLMKNLNSDGFLAEIIEEKKTLTTEIPQKILKCPNCGGTNLIWDYDTGETVCGYCGLVLWEQMMDKGPEWRVFTPEEKRSKKRVGGPVNYAHYDKDMSTTIRIDKDAFGRPLPPKVKRQMWRLRRWQLRSRIHSSEYRNLMQAMNELERISEILQIPSSVQEMAAVIYRKALNKGLIRGRCIAAIVAAALYAACRFTKTPKTLNEIAEASLRDKDEVARSYRLVIRKLMMKMPIHDPLDYISKIAGRANICEEVQGLAVKILHEVKRRHLNIGKDPYGIAAAVLYIACKLKDKKKTQKEIAEAAGVTEVTVRNRKKDLMKKLEIKIKYHKFEAS